MSSFSGSAAADAEEFVSRAEQIHAAVTGLASGEMKPEDTNELLSQINQRKKRVDDAADPVLQAARDAERAAAEEDRKRRGVPGQGARPGYLFFCRACFREYDIDPTPATASKDATAAAAKNAPKSHLQCTQCKSSLITREERMAELQAKVAVLTEHKMERARRRQRFAQWSKEKSLRAEEPKMVVLTGKAGEEEKEESPSSAVASSSLSSKYQDWDLWEPSSDEEAQVPEPDHPEFAAMKADIEARDARKRAARAVSDRANEAGNEAVKRRDYLAAVEHYTRAIDATRSEKSFYTNRALALIHSFDYARAVKDCTTALDIFDCFESEHRTYRLDYKNMKIVLKAYMRRARAQIALGLLGDARASLESATDTVREVYEVSGRREPAYAKTQKDELAEIQKMIVQVTEKEAFVAEEKKGVTQATASVATGTSSAVEATPAGAANASTASSASSQADTTAIDALLASLTSAHQHMLSDAASNAPTGVSASWSLFTPALNLLAATLDDADGNKERVATHVDSRIALDAVIKLCKQAQLPARTSSVSSTASLPPSLPDFGVAAALFAPSHANRAANCVAFRERDGFAALGRYLMRLLVVVGARAPAGEPVPPEVLAQATRVLAVLTDREAARDYFAGPSQAGTVTELALSGISDSSPSHEEMRLSSANLLANLAHQPRYRQWIAAPEQMAAGTSDRVVHAILEQTMTCTTTGGKGVTSASVLSSCLSVVINLLAHPVCRQRFVGAADSASDAPLTLLLRTLDALATGWSRSSYAIGVGSPLGDVSEKVLSLVMNLAVDDAANERIFAALAPNTVVDIIKLVESPSRTSAASERASTTSITSVLPPMLVERALGVLTRGVRREHQAAQAAAAAKNASGAVARPLRKLLLGNGGVNVLLRVLALHAFATAEEGVSADTVLAKLRDTASDTTQPESATTTTTTPTSFRYTRPTMEHASVCLAVCMSSNSVAALEVSTFSYQCASGLAILVSLLSSPHKNLVGNACLCVDSVCGVSSLLPRPELSAALDRLVAILKDPASKAAHQNAAKAAILIGRAPNNVERWTKMRGIEIIATVLKMK